MLILLTGASGAGKSTFALRLAKNLSGNRIFISTEIPDGDIKAEPLKLHSDGFVFIERFTDIGSLEVSGGVAVVDCLCNLTANEMFDKNGHISENVVRTVTDGIILLAERFEYLVAVTNEISSDGNTYETDIVSYRNALCTINRELAAVADCVIELCVSIPIVIKGNLSVV